jgi:hypothetical protein
MKIKEVNSLYFKENKEDSIGVSPLDGDYRDRRNLLSFCVRNGNRRFQIAMTVFNQSYKIGYKNLMLPSER